MVRVRFAPSPTGYLHIGSARTALFNWVYARHYGGTFLLRVEDTDLTRSEARYLEEIMTDLKWLGISWDEEPIHQSKRFDIYLAAAEGLVKAGKAYREGPAYIFKMPEARTIEVNDMIHGKVSFNTNDIKDQVMMSGAGRVPCPAFPLSISGGTEKMKSMERERRWQEAQRNNRRAGEEQ